MDIQKTLSRLQTLCSKKECCSTDIFKKALADLDGDRDAATSVLESLMKDGFVDDLRYCGCYAREKAQLTGWGPIKISFMLAGKGMKKETIRQALQEIDFEKADDRLTKILETKYRTVKGEPDEKFRLIKFALTRGYEYDDVSKAVNAVIAEARRRELEGEDTLQEEQ